MLNSALAQSGWEKGDVTANNWRRYVLEKLAPLDWTQAFADVQRFLMNQEDLIAFKKESIAHRLEG
jgi:hypothetical protein